jgi:hypothetical protein
MRQRILTGWTIQRALFLIIGIVILVQSIMQKQWIGVGVGGYFAAMGLFSFGCAAAGGCYSGACNTDPQTKNKTGRQE